MGARISFRVRIVSSLQCRHRGRTKASSSRAAVDEKFHQHARIDLGESQGVGLRFGIGRSGLGCRVGVKVWVGF